MAKSFENVQAARPVEIAGYPCLVRRSSLTAWLMAGLVPQDLAEELIRRTPQAGGDDDAEPTDPREAMELGRRLQRFKIERCVTTDNGAPLSFEYEAGKVCIFDLDDPDLFITEALAAIESQAIQTTEGEVSADALLSFREDGNGTPGLAGASVHGAHV